MAFDAAPIRIDQSYSRGIQRVRVVVEVARSGILSSPSQDAVSLLFSGMLFSQARAMVCREILQLVTPPPSLARPNRARSWENSWDDMKQPRLRS